MTLTGQCHCGSVKVVLEPGVAVEELPLRACQCSFCRRHGAATTSHPQSRLFIEAAPGSLSRYRFGRRQVDALICAECGVYMASYLPLESGAVATLNAWGAGLEPFAARTPEPVTYDDETDEAKLARRQARWTPTELVEALPSA
ncbi:MAG TPA: aldehyde-activating protein [Phenylobacterium sp.]